VNVVWSDPVACPYDEQIEKSASDRATQWVNEYGGYQPRYL